MFLRIVIKCFCNILLYVYVDMLLNDEVMLYDGKLIRFVKFDVIICKRVCKKVKLYLYWVFECLLIFFFYEVCFL